MKNTLSIMSDGTICDCVDSVADGTNSLYIELEVGNATGAVLKVWLNGTLKSTVNLVANEINYINISPELFTANGVITFQYLDDDYTGQVFSINFPAELDGNLSVDKTSDYVFTVKYTKSDGVSIVIDSELSTTSENAVQNKVVTDAINKKQDTMTIDSALSVSSTNPVQNKIITSALNNKVVVGGKNTNYLKRARFIIARYASPYGWGVSIPLFPNTPDQIFTSVNGAFVWANVAWSKKNGTITESYTISGFNMTLDTITYFF